MQPDVIEPLGGDVSKIAESLEGLEACLLRRSALPVFSHPLYRSYTFTSQSLAKNTYIYTLKTPPPFTMSTNENSTQNEQGSGGLLGGVTGILGGVVGTTGKVVGG